MLSDYEKPNCEANKTYKAENITCTCTEKGEWPNDECYFHFERINSYDQTCEPEKFVFIDCNVCRCGYDGKIDKSQCTRHKCNATKESRRSRTIDSSCKPKKWYSFAPCRICYCVNEHKLICNNENKSWKIRLQNYELSECGNLLLDMKELMSGKNALRQESRENKEENREEIIETSSNESDVHTLDIDKETTVNYNQPKVKEQKTNNKLKHEVSKTSKSAKTIKNKSKLRKGTKEKTWREFSDKENLSKMDASNILDNNILNLVLRKSLVSLGSGNECRPGSSTRVGCNNCFCLTNGKLLCTKNKCK